MLELRLRRDTAASALEAMPPIPKKRMREALRLLPEDPSGRTTGLDVKRLRTAGEPAVYRLRVGTWRAAFVIRSNHVDIVRIFARNEGYGWLERRAP